MNNIKEQNKILCKKLNFISIDYIINDLKIHNKFFISGARYKYLKENQTIESGWWQFNFNNKQKQKLSKKFLELLNNLHNYYQIKSKLIEL